MFALLQVNFVIYVLSGIFILLSLALVFAWYRIRHPGLILMSSTYGSAAVLALMLMEWWPLLAGFALAWVLRLMGLDPGPEAHQDGEISNRKGRQGGEGS